MTLFSLMMSQGFTAQGLNLEVIPGNTVISSGGGKAYVLVRLTGEKTQLEERSPLNLSLVIDRSGSMAGNKIKYVKKAAIDAINLLDEQKDIVSLVIYDDEINVLYPAQTVNKNRLKSLIEEITDRGSTALHGGMMEGVSQAEKKKKGDYITRVLLLSDGLANVGQVDPEFIATDARKSFEKGVSITTLGVGADYNENLMVSIAKNAHGNYYFIESPAQIEKIFNKEFSSLLSVVAKDIRIRLTPLSKTTIKGAIGYELNGQEIQAYNIYSGGDSFFLLELDVPRITAGSKSEVFKVDVDYFDVALNKAQTLSKTLSLGGVQDKPEELVNLDVFKAYVDLKMAEHLEQITKYLDQRKNEDAKKYARQQIDFLRNAQKTLKSPKVDQDIATLEAQVKKIEALGNRSYQESEEGKVLKKAMQQQSFDQMSK